MEFFHGIRPEKQIVWKTALLWHHSTENESYYVATEELCWYPRLREYRVANVILHPAITRHGQMHQISVCSRPIFTLTFNHQEQIHSREYN